MKSIKVLLAACILPFLLIGWARSDEEMPPSSRTVTTDNGKYYFQMIPDELAPFDREGGSGTCYEVADSSSDKVLWTTSGWFSYRVYLSEDGQYLVRMGNWPRGRELSSDDLAVAFYSKGVLLKSYSTKDLVKDPGAIEATVSHYCWEEDTRFDPAKQRLLIATKDGIEYVFDIKTGNIVSQKHRGGKK